MKIIRVEAVPLSIPSRYGADAWALGSGGWQALDFCLVRVDTDAGITGWGEAFSYSCRRPVAAAVNDMIAPLAVGHDAADIDGLHATIQRRLHIFGRFGIAAFALSGLDIALWDIAGKAAGKPLHALLGGARRERLSCYASLLRYADGALAARYCERALGEGFGAIKLHEVSEPVIAAARAAVPRETALLLDVNCEWSVEAAKEMGRRLAPMDLEWFEEPVFPPEDGAGLRAVGEACGIPIAAGENCCFATQFAALFEARAVQIAQPSVTKIGGITEFRRVAALAARHGVRLAPHSPYFGPGALATLHLLAALEANERFEYFYLWAEASLYGAALAPERGELPVPQGAGLGADPDANVIRRYRAD
jgi:D-galactarolactone cycloisomerase